MKLPLEAALEALSEAGLEKLMLEAADEALWEAGLEAVTQKLLRRKLGKLLSKLAL